MTSGSVAKRYAKALFEIGQEKNNLLAMLNQIQQLADLWQENEALQEAMTNPQISNAARRKVWQEIASRSGINKTGRNFLNLIIDKSRLQELPSIARELLALTDEKENRIRAELVSAAPVSQEGVTRLKSALERLTGKVVILSTKVDESLVGGMVTRVGDTLYDGSIKNQLNRLKANMLGRA